MPVSERQLAEFADKHAWQVPLDTSPATWPDPGMPGTSPTVSQRPDGPASPTSSTHT